MQNDHTVQLDHERLCLEQEDESAASKTTTVASTNTEAAEEPFMAMVVLPAKIKSGRHSRPLAPPVQPRQPGPGSARRLQEPPVVPPRPEHTLTSDSRPVPASVSNIPVMELVSLPSTAASSGLLRKPVSLTSPRPEPEREGNLYTEAPKKVLPQKSHQNAISVISSQVLAAPSKKSSSLSNAEESTIFCQECGKCKCEACCRPRKLPEKWLCGGTCLCSQSTVIDSLSCMCCVKGVVYHCTKDHESEQDLDPCSCSGQHTFVKWATLATCWPFIPCLLTYPLLSTCAKMTQVIYAKCTASGCQCQRSSNASNTISSQQPLSLNKMIIDSQPQLERLIKPKLKP